MIWAGAMMLAHLGENAAARAVLAGIEASLSSPTKTADLGGTASTREVGELIARSVTHTAPLRS
jgi:tartrate dehydrogenase/decarboxylase/D-malate dehydrogenase